MYLIKERVVGALPRTGLLDGVPTHHLHDGVQLTTQQLTCLQNMHTNLHGANTEVAMLWGGACSS